MSFRILLAAAAVVAVAAPAGAHDKVKHKHKHKQVERTCVCTMGQPGTPHVAPLPPIPAIPAVPAVPPIPPGASWQMHPGGNVMVFRDDGDERVVIVRKHGTRFRDSADDNNDGEVSRREFMRRAEKHFKERDKNDNGKLDEDELGPMSFEFALPSMPHEAPEARED